MSAGNAGPVHFWVENDIKYLGVALMMSRAIEPQNLRNAASHQQFLTNVTGLFFVVHNKETILDYFLV